MQTAKMPWKQVQGKDEVASQLLLRLAGRLRFEEIPSCQARSGTKNLDRRCIFRRAGRRLPELDPAWLKRPMRPDHLAVGCELLAVSCEAVSCEALLRCRHVRGHSLQVVNYEPCCISS